MSLLIPTRTYARKGERITCEKGGHHICTVARDIPIGSKPDRAYFTDWQQPEPIVGQMIPDCRICQSRWCQWHIDGPLLHFWDGGWRWAEAAF